MNLRTFHRRTGLKTFFLVFLLLVVGAHQVIRCCAVEASLRQAVRAALAEARSGHDEDAHACCARSNTSHAEGQDGAHDADCSSSTECESFSPAGDRAPQSIASAMSLLDAVPVVLAILHESPVPGFREPARVEPRAAGHPLYLQNQHLLI